jgi:hypothetical protein
MIIEPENKPTTGFKKDKCIPLGRWIGDVGHGADSARGSRRQRMSTATVLYVVVDVLLGNILGLPLEPPN